MEQRQFKLAMGAWVVFHLITTWNTWLYISSNSFFAAGAPLGRNHPWTDYLMLSCYLVAVGSVDWLLLRTRRRNAARNLKWYWIISLLTGGVCLLMPELMDSFGLAGYAAVALTPFLPLTPLIGPVTWVLVAGFPVINLLFCWWVQWRA